MGWIHDNLGRLTLLCSYCCVKTIRTSKHIPETKAEIYDVREPGRYECDNDVAHELCLRKSHYRDNDIWSARYWV